MISVEHIDVYGFEHAVRGMRNPMNSWDKSDSEWKIFTPEYPYLSEAKYIIGSNDLDLMQRLYKSGTEHRTYARMIMVWMDITAPLYWWKEADRYTVGKCQVSTSTMHKIHAKEFTLDDFSHEQLSDDVIEKPFKDIIDCLNFFRGLYIQHKDKDAWWQMIQLLPSSYNQKRTICMSYEVVFKMIRERTGHRLDEWNTFVEILKTLPYVREIMECGQHGIVEEPPVPKMSPKPPAKALQSLKDFTDYLDKKGIPYDTV